MLNSLDYGYLIGPRIQIVDADGKPMTGAWLRVFIAGTTTDANTFSDWEGTVQPAKKILDARGETTIIAAVSGAYKIMLCDSTHPVSSPYWYADNVLLANGSGTAGAPFGFSNPSFYVKGNSIYGGMFTDNLNNLARNTPFTCLGTATGAPDASYSWFGWHINSNTGTTAAAQIAYAFNSSAIICYERVKTSGTWGAWKLRGSTMQIQTFGSGALTAFPGIFYVASSLTDFVLTLAPSIGGEYHIKFTTAATIGTIDLSSVTSWIGSAPSIAAGKTYELDILDGVGVMAEVS